MDLTSQIIRKLSSDEVGWLEEEIDDVTFGRNIIMTEQGIMLAELLARLEKPETAEFSSYIYCTDDSPKRYDVEIQRADAGARPHRARYHSSAMDIENLSAGQEFEELPDTYTIFITENDVYGMGKAIYPIERTNMGTGELFNDGEHIIYVNGAYEGEADIGKLMHDFRCTDGKNMNYELLAQTTDYFKNTKEGVSTVCKVMEDMRNEIKYDIARNMLKDGLPIEKVAQYSQLSVDKIEELKRTLEAIA